MGMNARAASRDAPKSTQSYEPARAPSSSRENRQTSDSLGPSADLQKMHRVYADWQAAVWPGSACISCHGRD